MTVINWTLLRSIRPTLNVEHADESELQKLEDAADELNKVENAVEDVREIDDLQTLFAVAQKVIKVKTLQTEAALEELETTLRSSAMVQENERLRRELARLRGGDRQGENQLKKLQEELVEVQLALKREKQNVVKYQDLYDEAERDRKSLQVEILSLQTELDEKIKDAQKQELQATNQMSEKQVIAKLKEKNEQITKLMLALQEEESINEDLRGTIDQLGAKLRDATVEINQSADVIEDLRDANGALMNQVEHSRREVATLEGLVDEYTKKINELEAFQPPDVDRQSRSSSTDRLDTWRGILEAKNNDIHDLQVRNVHLQQELDSLLSSTNMSTLAVLKKAIAEKDQQIKSLAESLSQATLDIEDNTRIIETLKGELVSRGQSQKDEIGDRERLRRAEDTNAELEKQLLDREEQLADALLVARKYEMGVYGLSDAVTEIRVCKRKIASRDKNIKRLQDQLAESYVEVERLTRENEQLCQGLTPAPPAQAPKDDNLETEKVIFALEEEILSLKKSLRDLQRNVVDGVHRVSSDWSPKGDKRGGKGISQGSSDEENLDRCQISQVSPKRNSSQETDAGGADVVSYGDIEVENQRLKEFLVQILETLQAINTGRNSKTNAAPREEPARTHRKEAEIKQVSTSVVRSTPRPPKRLTKSMRFLREYISEVLAENDRLANEIDAIRLMYYNKDVNDHGKLFESVHQQVLRQRVLLSTYSGVLAEQLAYTDCLHDVYTRQLRAVGGNAQPAYLKPKLSYQVNFNYIGDLKQQIRQLNRDLVSAKRALHHENAVATQDAAAAVAVSDQTENLFMIEKLRMQLDMLSKQHIRTQKFLVEREDELLQVHEKLREALACQSAEPSAQQQPIVPEANPKGDRLTPAAPRSGGGKEGDDYDDNDDDDDDDTIQGESQTESERSISQSNFYRKMDSLREYNRKLCSELAEAKCILRRTQDALKIKEVMLKELNKQQIVCGNLEQKMKVMEISLETTKQLLGHKEQTLERYRQLVTDLKQQIISIKVQRNVDIEQLEKTHMNSLYEAKKQIAELTMKTFHRQKLALDNDAVPDQGSFEKILAEKQVQIVQLQNKIKALCASEFRLKGELGQVGEVNQRLCESNSELQERLRAAERIRNSVSAVPPEVAETIATSNKSTNVLAEHERQSDTEQPSKQEEQQQQQEEIDDLREKLSNAENKVARLKRTADDAKEKIAALEAEVEQQNAKIEQLRKIQTLRRTDPKRMRILEDAVEDLRRQLYEAKQQQQRAEKPYDDVEKQTKQTIEVARWEESKKWQMTVESLKEKLKEKHASMEQLEANQCVLRAQVARLEKEKYRLLDRIKAGSSVDSEHTQKIDALLKRIRQLERMVDHLRRPKKRSRPKENQVVPILVSPRSPRRHKERRSVSFDASVIDNEASPGELDDDTPDESRLEDEPMPPDLAIV